jgi:hypothetical protein
MSDWLEQYVEDYNNRVYKGLMSPSANRLLREMKRKEHEEWEREAADVVYGYDEFERPGHDDQ